MQLRARPASTSPCSLAMSAQNHQFTINCQGVAAKEQVDKLAAIVNKILINKLDPQLVMAKLDEIPKSSRQDSPAKTYFCDGMWQSAATGSDPLLDSKTGGNDSDFLNMIELLRGLVPDHVQPETSRHNPALPPPRTSVPSVGKSCVVNISTGVFIPSARIRRLPQARSVAAS